MNNHLNQPLASDQALDAYSKRTWRLFFVISILLTVPVMDLPFLGLSLTAPLFFLVAMDSIFRAPIPWSNFLERKYVILAAAIWFGVFLSAAVNGMWSGSITSYSIATIVRFAYWLFIFLLTIYSTLAGRFLEDITRVLGWGVLILALLRWLEVFLYGNIGAWSGTRFLTENDYGFLFSMFAPFLLGLFFSPRKWESRLSALGNIVLWGAAGINGSRGSWVAIVVGVLLFFFVLMISRPGKSLGFVLMIFLLAGFAFVVFSDSFQISQAISSRLNTFQNLNEEKSYMIRTLMNQKALRLFEASPIFGVGVGRFQTSYVPLEIPRVLNYASQTHFNVKSSHNSYLGLLAESGLVGSVPYAILLLLLAVLGFKSSYALTKKKQYWGIVIYCGFVSMSIHMWVISSLTNTANWFLYGLVAAMVIISQKERLEKRETGLSLPHSRHLKR